MIERKEDMVNHPVHYEGSTSLECIDAMRIAFGEEALIAFCKLNAFKYLWRHKNKNGKQDVQKAQWYLDKASSLLDLSKNNLENKQIKEMINACREAQVEYEAEDQG